PCPSLRLCVFTFVPSRERNLSPTLTLRNGGGGDFQNAPSVLVKTVTNLFGRSAFFFLNPHRETLALALTFHFRRQVTAQIRTPVRRVMLLIALVVTKHVHAIEVRLVSAVRRV